MSQIIIQKIYQRKIKTIYSVLANVKSRNMMKILKENGPMNYSVLMDIWNRMNGNKNSSGMFGHVLRNLDDYNLVGKEKGRKLYYLTFKGKKIMTVIETVDRFEKINIHDYPDCLKLRVSNILDDEELLNEAVSRILKAIKRK